MLLRHGSICGWSRRSTDKNGKNFEVPQIKRPSHVVLSGRSEGDSKPCLVSGSHSYRNTYVRTYFSLLALYRLQGRAKLWNRDVKMHLYGRRIQGYGYMHVLHSKKQHISEVYARHYHRSFTYIWDWDKENHESRNPFDHLIYRKRPYWKEQRLPIFTSVYLDLLSNGIWFKIHAHKNYMAHVMALYWYFPWVAGNWTRVDYNFSFYLLSLIFTNYENCFSQFS